MLLFEFSATSRVPRLFQFEPVQGAAVAAGGRRRFAATADMKTALSPTERTRNAHEQAGRKRTRRWRQAPEVEFWLLI